MSRTNRRFQVPRRNRRRSASGITRKENARQPTPKSRPFVWFTSDARTCRPRRQLSLKKNSDPFSIVGISGRIWFLILSFLRGRVEHKFVLPKDAKLSERARKALARAAREASALDKARRTNGSRCRLPNECRRWVSKLDLHAEQSILAKSKIDFESASVATAATATEDETAPHSFKIGDRVQCRVAGQWVKDKIGIIVAHHKDNETFDVRLGGDWGGMDLRNKPLSDLRTPRSPRVSSSSRSRTKGGCVLL